MSGITDFTVKASDGSAFDLSRYTGRVLLIVNKVPPGMDLATLREQVEGMYKAEVAALKAVRQSRMVDPHQVEDRGVEVVDGDGILDHAVAQVVGGPVGDAPLDPAAGHPDGEAVVIVIAAVDLAGVGASRRELDDRCATEFPAPVLQCRRFPPTKSA